MGLYIHYSGKLKKDVLPADINKYVVEVCEINEWGYHILNDKLPENKTKDSEDKLSGIFFVPEECKSMFLCFEADGKLYNPRYKLLHRKHDDEFFSDHIEFNNPDTCSIDISPAGYIGHKKIIKLFKELSDKFFSEFNLKDDSGYWETGDEKKLMNYFGLSDIKIEVLKEIIGRNSKMDLTLEKAVDMISRAEVERRYRHGPQEDF